MRRVTIGDLAIGEGAPLLAIAGLPARAIMGYCFVAFVAAGLCLGGGLLFVGAG